MVIARATLQNSQGGGAQENVQADLTDVEHGKIMSVTSGENAVGAIDQAIEKSGAKRMKVFIFPDERELVKRIKLDLDSGDSRSGPRFTVHRRSGITEAMLSSVAGGGTNDEANQNADED
ncbi:hypothetical protein JDV02_008889 [Purpureocillium takamizusanense]|uniref:Uncharacterized protein n=1 Tax=Purpureocillium takamizusanense TaxID=2060973 RepID=A0A9Q8VF59_9HYPO|nr:uncharacterized protein JDV02_008889 [Purpureocillium takamizusanense]UNI23046.1 hypothetical protein JDV02_008889 [Purpureocillium takamizusanense]